MNLMKRVFKSENNFTNLFSKSKDYGSFIRYYDDAPRTACRAAAAVSLFRP